MPLTSFNAISASLLASVSDFGLDNSNDGIEYGVSSDSTLWAEAPFMNLPFNTSNETLLYISEGVVFSVLTKSPESTQGSFYLYGGENAALIANMNYTAFANEEMYIIPSNKQSLSYLSSQWQYDKDLKVPKDIRDRLENLVIYPNSYLKIGHTLYIQPASFEEYLLIYNILDRTWASVEYPKISVSSTSSTSNDYYNNKEVDGQCMVYNGTYIFFMGGIYWDGGNVTSMAEIFVFDPSTNKFLDNSNEYYIKNLNYQYNNDNINEKDMLIWHSCISYESNIYIIGWLNSYNYTFSYDMYEYSFDRQTWIKYYNILKKDELGASYQLIHNKIYYISGYTLEFQNFSEIVNGQIEICTINIKTNPNDDKITCQISDDSLTLPESRTLAMSVYDESYKYLYIVGGLNVYGINGTFNYTIRPANKAYRLDLGSSEVNDAIKSLGNHNNDNNNNNNDNKQYD